MLLLVSLTTKDQSEINGDGILGDLECSLWNSGFLLWGGLVTSTWSVQQSKGKQSKTNNTR